MKAEAAHWTKWRMEANQNGKRKQRYVRRFCGKEKQLSGKTKNKDVTYIVLQETWDQCFQVKESKKLVCELEGYRWDAIFLSETWRQDKSEIWETHHKHILMGAEKYDNKHRVGIMLNKK